MGVIIDVVLAAVTAGIGWLVWTAVLFTKRQTPAGRLRDKVIVDARTARLASPGKYVARQVVGVLSDAVPHPPQVAAPGANGIPHCEQF